MEVKHNRVKAPRRRWKIGYEGDRKIQNNPGEVIHLDIRRTEPIRNKDNLEHRISYAVEDKINAVLNWAGETRNDFDTTFVESLHSSYEVYDSLTSNQESALDRIIKSFRIDVEEWC